MENESEQSTDQSPEQSPEQSHTTNNDSNNNSNTTSDVEIFNNETKKTSRQQFKEECIHCSKIFKSKITYDKHILQQLCYSADEITYCKICCITLSNHNKYKKHLFTGDIIYKKGLGINNSYGEDTIELKSSLIDIINKCL